MKSKQTKQGTNLQTEPQTEPQTAAEERTRSSGLWSEGEVAEAEAVTSGSTSSYSSQTTHLIQEEEHLS